MPKDVTARGGSDEADNGHCRHPTKSLAGIQHLHPAIPADGRQAGRDPKPKRPGLAPGQSIARVGREHLLGRGQRKAPLLKGAATRDRPALQVDKEPEPGSKIEATRGTHRCRGN